MLHFIYELYSAATNIAGYIGITTNPNARHKQHVDGDDTNARKRAWIRNNPVKMRILEVVETETLARERERHWIHHYLRQGIQLVNIAGIEGVPPVQYNGDLFASTIAARWGVFFHTLNIPYEYRKQTYDLDGLSYTPDFYLPQQDCFLSVGGLEYLDPQDDILPRLLAMYTDKYVHVVHGNITIPSSSAHCHGFTRSEPPRFGAYQDRRRIYRKIDISMKAMRVLQELDDIGLQLEDILGTLYLQLLPCYHPIQRIDDYIDLIQKQARIMPLIASRIEAVSEELTKAYDQGREWQVEYRSQITHTDFQIAECTRCGGINIEFCSSCQLDANLAYTTDRLIKAYEVALSTQFEQEEQ